MELSDNFIDLKTIFDRFYVSNMNDNQYVTILKSIQNGEVNESIERLHKLLNSESTNQDKIHYLLGNAYRKLGNWQLAMNHYQYALDLNPHSPASTAKSMLIDIMNFYNKDMFNQ